MALMTCPLCAETIPAGGGWCPFCRSDLPLKSNLAPGVTRALPVDNTFGWALVAVPIVYALVAVAFGPRAALLAAIVLNAVFAVQDEKRVRAAGYAYVGALWGLIFVPVYLFIRSRRTGNWAIFLAWGLVFLAYVAAVSLAATA